MAVSDYTMANSAAHAVDLRSGRPGSAFLAGGTTLMPLINEGRADITHLIGLRRAGLDSMAMEDGWLRIGAMVRVAAVAAQEWIPVLAEAARHVGGPAIRNLGTVGGSIVAGPPCGDLAVALLALDAQVGLARPEGTHMLDLGQLYASGIGEHLLTEVRVPLPRGRTAYRKLGRRRLNTPSVVTLAVHVVVDAGRVTEARIAIHGVAAHPVRAARAESALVGRVLDGPSTAAAAAAATEEVSPADDALATAWYRRRMVGVMLRRVLADIAGLQVG